MGAIDEVGFTASTPNIVQVDCTSASTKMSITEGYCICYNKSLLLGESQMVPQNL